MKFLGGLAASIADAFRNYVLPFLRALFGQFRWTPPVWLQRTAASLRSWNRRAIDWLAAHRAANPVGFWITTLALIAFVIGGYGGWRWYENLPEPHYLELS